jgi:hypothetical protein
MLKGASLSNKCKFPCRRGTFQRGILPFVVTTEFGYYEGEPPPGYKEFFRKLYQEALDKAKEEEKRRKASDKSS